MRTLFIATDVGSPPRDGLQRNTIQLLTLLAEWGSCDLITLQTGGQLQYLPTGVNLLHRQQRSNIPKWLVRHFLHRYLLRSKDSFREAIEKALETSEYDLLFFEGIGVLPYLRQRSPIPQVFNLIDPPSKRNVRLAENSNAVKHYALAAVGFALEKTMLSRANVTLVVSDEDAAFLRKVHPKVCVATAPVIGPQVDPTIPLKVFGPDVLILSDMRFEHLSRSVIWFIQHCSPQLKDFSIAVLAKGSNGITCPKNVTTKEWVDNFDKYVRSAKIVVTPDQTGTGIKNRVIHALLLGRPVVGTAAAFEGIKLTDGVHAIQADTASEFISAINRLYKDPELRERIGLSGQLFARERYSFEVSARRWRDILSNIATGSRH